MTPMFFTTLLVASVGVYGHYHDIATHPDETRRRVHPPTRETLGNRLHFCPFRDIDGDLGKVQRQIDRANALGLGDFINADYLFVFHGLREDALSLVKKNGWFLYDLWGFVPGNGENCSWGQRDIPPGTSERFAAVLGDHWLGMDNGEQDGRWIQQYSYLARTKEEAFDRFHDHFAEFDRLMGHKLCAVESLNFGHYFLRTQNYAFLGCETAQSLPNSQVYYAFIRGAGKQYGVPWSSNISVFNHWGWKRYPDRASVKTGLGERRGSDWYNDRSGPWCGASLALQKKLMFSHIFYNALAFCFEGGTMWRDGEGLDALCPTGRIQYDGSQWFRKYGDPGVMQTPVAIVTPFGSGWCFPRTGYNREAYRVWGRFAYGPGDYFLHGVLSMLYPGYEDSGYFENEDGFITPTPYGDIADCLLSDAPAWLLKRYSLVVLAGDFNRSAEFADTLAEYVKSGGRLVLTKGTATSVFGGDVPENAVLLPSENGIVAQNVCAVPTNGWNYSEKLANPYPLDPAVRTVLDRLFRETALFTTGGEDGLDGLSVVSCRRGRGDYTVLVENHTWKEQPLLLRSNVGRILKTEELPIPYPEREMAGFCAACVTNTLSLGHDAATTIAAGGVRAIRVKVDESAREIAYEKPPANAENRILALRSCDSLARQLNRRPTFFRHWDGVMLDWKAVFERDDDALRRDRDFVNSQGLRVIVDFRGGLDLFPHYRLVGQHRREEKRSQTAFSKLFAKCRILGADTVVIGGHGRLETWDVGQYHEVEFGRNLKKFCAEAAENGMSVRFYGGYFGRWEETAKTRGEADKLFAEVGASNLCYAAPLGGRECDFVMLAEEQPSAMTTGGVVSRRSSLCRSNREGLKDVLRSAVRRGVTLVFDIAYDDVDEEYLDALFVEGDSVSR